METLIVSRIRLCAVGLCVLLTAGCGGSSHGPEPASGENVYYNTDQRRRSLAAPAEDVSVEALFDWAEYEYPDMFPRGPLTFAHSNQGKDYSVRAYSGNWGTRYLALSSDGEVWGLGDFTGQSLRSFGRASDFAPRVLAGTCKANPRACSDARYRLPLLSQRSGYALALRSDGAVLSWGAGYSGWNDDVAGLGSQIAGTSMRDTGLRGTAVAATESAGFVLAIDGRVLGWGAVDRVGGLRTSALAKTSGPIVAAFPENIQSIAAGGRPLLAVRSDGTVWYSPGEGVDGLSSSPLSQRWSAIQVPKLTGVDHVTGTPGVHESEVAVGKDGSVLRLQISLNPSVAARVVDMKPALVTYYKASASKYSGLPSVRTARCDELTCIALSRDGTLWLFSRTDTSNPAFKTPVQLRSPAVYADVWITPAGLALDAWGQVWDLGPALRAASVGGMADPIRINALTDVADVVATQGGFIVRRNDGSIWWLDPPPSVPSQIAGVLLR